MKKLIIMFLLPALLCGSVPAQGKGFRPAVIVKTDGTKMECVAKYPKDFGTRNIEYCADAGSRKKLKLKSDSIRTLHYYLDDERWVEFDRYPVMPFRSLWKDRQKTDFPRFLNVVKRGPVTLYKNTVYQRGGGSFSYYYCKREGEAFASNLSMGRGIYFSSFQKVAGDYFADSPALAEKIRNGEDGYKPADIEAIVDEYNAGKPVQ
jgi:hypothetical protein